jgi:hypothetical protein
MKPPTTTSLNALMRDSSRLAVCLISSGQTLSHDDAITTLAIKAAALTSALSADQLTHDRRGDILTHCMTLSAHLQHLTWQITKDNVHS